jgi:quercetin dioxygenase-like cupin family protein
MNDGFGARLDAPAATRAPSCTPGTVGRAGGASRSPNPAIYSVVGPKERAVQITRNSLDTAVGPAEWFTGTVYIDAVAAATAPSRVASAAVHFTPGARTAWHTHPLGQTIYVTEGVGRCQRRGGPVEVIRPGDRVYFEPGENHWHGAAPNRLMTHIAIHESDDSGSPVTWGEHVTDEEYAAAPATSP